MDSEKELDLDPLFYACPLLDAIEAVLPSPLRAELEKLQQDAGVQRDQITNPDGPAGDISQNLYDAYKPVTKERLTEVLCAVYTSLGDRDLRNGLQELAAEFEITINSASHVARISNETGRTMGGR